MKRFSFTKSRLIGLVCGALLPTMAIGNGISMLIRDVIFNLGLAITYFVFPLIVIGLLSLCIFSNCKTWKKIVSSGAILVLFLILFFVSTILTGWKRVKRYEGNEAVQRYSSVRSEIMPDLSEVGNTTKIEYYNVFSSYFVFSAETDYLICQYEQEEYEFRKNLLDSAYTFQTETITNQYSSCEPMAQIDDYQFRMLSVENYGLFYPKEIILIGCSDTAREIVYLNFRDLDLDYISSLEEFIVDKCGWKFIR